MDFMNGANRPSQPSHNAVQGPASGTSRGNDTNKHSGGKKGMLTSLRFASVILLFSATILVVALLIYLAIGGKNPNQEEKYVNGSQLQAVFLNGGQVYFGKINNITDDYIRLSNIFYLRVNQQVQPEQEGTAAANANDISLVKLGCELHRPTNEMLINREQVIFWENLKADDGANTVPGAVKAYLQQFPNGQECEAEAQAGAQEDATEEAEEEPAAEDSTETNLTP